jgi:hypothetical protein
MDNDIELLGLFEKMKFSCDSTIKRYVVVVDKYEKQVAVLKTTLAKQDKQIEDLKSQVKASQYSYEQAKE